MRSNHRVGLALAITLIVSARAEMRGMTPDDAGAAEGRRPLRVVVTGFGPFGRFAENPSWQAVRRLEPDAIDGARITVGELPVVWDGAALALAELVAREEPDVVICFGVAGGAGAFRPEQTARNWNRDGPDNEGVRLRGADVPDAPRLYPTRLPIEAIERALRAARLPVKRSDDAGGYLCNQIFFRAVHMAVTGDAGPSAEERASGRAGTVVLPPAARPRWVGFVHVPGVGERGSATRPGLPQDEIDRGVRVIVEATIREALRARAAKPGGWY